MADKNKFIENAQKYLQKGQLDKAIKEYYRALDFDPSDIRNRHKLGELLARQGSRNEALREFSTVAEGYSKDGFYLKAVAVYKQMIRLREDLYDVHLKLGDLYQQLSLVSEAQEHFAVVSDYLEVNGTPAERIEILKRLIDLNPEDMSQKYKLADLHIASQATTDAVALYRGMVTSLQAAGKTDELIRVLHRLLQLSPNSFEHLKVIAKAYLDNHDPKSALTHLQTCFRSDPGDLAMLSMLADTFGALNQIPKAISVLEELTRLYRYQGLTTEEQITQERIRRYKPEEPQVMQTYGRKLSSETIHTGTSARSVRADAVVPAKIVALPSTNDAATALGLEPSRGVTPIAPAKIIPLSQTQAASVGRTFELPRVDPSPADSSSTSRNAAMPVPRAHLEAMRKIPASVTKMMTEVEVYLKYGLADKALSHLRTVVEKEPDCYVGYERLRDLLIQRGDASDAARMSLQLARLAIAAGDSELAQLNQEKAIQLDPSVTVARLPVLPATSAIVIPPTGEGTPPHRSSHRMVSQELDDGDTDESATTGTYSTLTVADLFVVQDNDAGTPEDSRMPPGQGVASEVADAAAAWSKTEPGVFPDASGTNGYSAALSDTSHSEIDIEDDMDLVKELEDDFADTPVTPQRPEERLETVMQLAAALLQMRLYDEALLELDRYQPHAALPPRGQLLVARCRGLKGQTSEAIRMYQSILNRNDLPDTLEAEVLFELGLSYEAQGDVRLAINIYEEITGLSGSFRPEEVMQRLTALSSKLGQSSSGSDFSIR